MLLAKGLAGPCSPILGHEGVGRIVALGRDVAPSPTARVGQRVGVGWIRDACGACTMCMRGEGQTRCSLKAFSGTPAAPGTWASTTAVPERYLLPLPGGDDDDDGGGGVDPAVVAPVMCAGVTSYKAVKDCEATSGSWVLVSGGAGGVGGLAVQYARAMGYRVVAVDGGRPGVRERSLANGAEGFVDFRAEGDVGAAVLEQTGGQMCAAAIVCVGAASAYESALSCLGPLGVLVCVGIPPPDHKFSVHPLFLIDSGIKIKASLVGSRSDVLEALEFVRRGVVQPNVVKITMEEMDDALRKVHETDGRFVVDLRG